MQQIFYEQYIKYETSFLLVILHKCLTKASFLPAAIFFTQKIVKSRKRHADTSFFSTEAKKQRFNSISDFLPRFYVVFHKKRAKKGRNSVQMSFFRDVLDK
ncbi:hypothetical protein [uncultured Ruminococcus sp.]|uniref:hypothetical protein n=1 Tax=uncultured Ruminococcus sp. TaxID=165186 RepID=UPI0026771E82|nr:hypothetical protein [uncultured Ruminococcus sp.]